MLAEMIGSTVLAIAAKSRSACCCGPGQAFLRIDRDLGFLAAAILKG
jgi:hypothetical protein